MREEVLERVEELRRHLYERQGRASDEACEEEPFFGNFNVRSGGAHLHERPARDSRVVAKIGSGRVLPLRARQGLWLRVGLPEGDAWLLAFDRGKGVGCLVDWRIGSWEP